jgi:hypothetical protein
MLSLDIDHFWEAYDSLVNCKNRLGSLLSFQNLYLDRVTDGLKDLIRVREFTVEAFVDVLNTSPKYYASVKQYTFDVRNAEPYITMYSIDLKPSIEILNLLQFALLLGFIKLGGLPQTSLYC